MCILNQRTSFHTCNAVFVIHVPTCAVSPLLLPVRQKKNHCGNFIVRSHIFQCMNIVNSEQCLLHFVSCCSSAIPQSHTGTWYQPEPSCNSLPTSPADKWKLSSRSTAPTVAVCNAAASASYSTVIFGDSCSSTKLCTQPPATSEVIPPPTAQPSLLGS